MITPGQASLVRSWLVLVLVLRVPLVTVKATHIATLINPFVTDGDALQLPWPQTALLDLEEWLFGWQPSGKLRDVEMSIQQGYNMNLAGRNTFSGTDMYSAQLTPRIDSAQAMLMLIDQLAIE
ncbi:hypothetical protein J3F84DRAFT_351438 [Trichoderma pleuroticola]